MEFPPPNPAVAERYYTEAYWRLNTTSQLFDNMAYSYSERIALSDAGGNSFTYRELRAHVESVASFFTKSGIGENDIVTICAPNWWQAVVCILATLRVGAAINPVPMTYGWKDIKFVVDTCQSKALILAGKFRSTAHTVHLEDILGPDYNDRIVIQIGEGERQVGKNFNDLLNAGDCPVPLPTKPDNVAAILFTSGTESKPKGVVHSHNTILFGERCFVETLGLDNTDICFMASPITHASGFLHGVILTLTTGGQLSILDVFTAAAAVDQMTRDKATWTMGATPFLVETANMLKVRQAKLPSLRYYLCGGAPLPEAVVRQAMETGMRVLSVYGSTESPPHTVVWPSDPTENAWTTDGRAAGAGVEIKIVDESGHECPPGEVGEEWSRGPNTFLGYLNAPEVTAKSLDADGWYHSGDLAYQRPDGSIRISGRIKDTIVRGGQNIAAREVEELLIKIPGCIECALVGIPHDRLGETGGAVLVMKPGHSVGVQEVYDLLVAQGVAKFKIPERVECWDELPKTPSGKIQKFKIQKMLAESKQDGEQAQ
ncbi:AMP-binding protein [uncultured Sneathiella sp.]|jgi:acyl-CoA synthetase|uniref:AMP-binding protein n=1 Tax=uncultured Sneathiella sp. TaxID=879315 RepID=UPI0030DAF723|tara:strand:- start:4257 stop:5888 length:1632 start_codon:yes stop_codon:yes gene_type:complete